MEQDLSSNPAGVEHSFARHGTTGPRNNSQTGPSCMDTGLQSLPNRLLLGTDATAGPGHLHLEARVLALEARVQALESGPVQRLPYYASSGQQNSTCGPLHATADTLRKEFTPGIQALGISASPALTGPAGFRLSQSNLQDELPASIGYGSMLPPQYNNGNGLTNGFIADDGMEYLPAGGALYPDDSNLSPFDDDAGRPFGTLPMTFRDASGSAAVNNGLGHRPGQRNLQVAVPANTGHESMLTSWCNNANELTNPFIAADDLGDLSAGGALLPEGNNIPAANVKAGQPFGAPCPNPHDSNDLQMNRDFDVNRYSEKNFINEGFDVDAASMLSGAAYDEGHDMPDASQVYGGHSDTIAASYNPATASPALSSAPGARVGGHRCRGWGSIPCDKTFRRKADRDRHSRIHDMTSIPLFPCTYQGCDRIGLRGYKRSDKLKEHRVKRGH
ncbi:hypothetical protein DL95DRAFT_517164 [Leptodontidium sp. 2 PMI_412]|nr:hypothetical protein DL95DRAFT_517164 [Leptodontidium sp. 2 PMI_412]